MFKKIFFSIIFFLSSISILNAQPFYYTSNYEALPFGHHGQGDIFRINMSIPSEVDSLMTNVFELGPPVSDEFGNWLAYEENFRLFILNPNNLNQKKMITDFCERIKKFSYSSAINKLIVLYDANMVLVDPTTLTISDTVSYEVHTDIITGDEINLSENGNLMYLIQGDSILLKPKIASYSFSSQQIIKTKFIDEISYPGADRSYFDFRRNGIGVVENYVSSIFPNKYFNIYFLDNDSLSITITHISPADGYVVSNGKYLLMFNLVLNHDSIGFSNTGEIDIYEMTNGEMVKTIQLPSDGEVMCFENYPNNIYYAIDIEEPTRQIYILKMDSIFNVLNLTSLDPYSVIVNSSAFTLTVNGHGFDSLSTVYFNEVGKTTTYVSDSVLTAEISPSDISVVGDYPAWVTDEWGTSDTLSFEVTPLPPVLNSMSPSLALPVGYYSENVDFTVTAKGANFNDSSIVYFDGSVKTTTYVSDSVLTFEINNYNDIATTGNYPVWVSNYNSNSDTLNFSVIDSLSLPLVPIVNCVRNNGGGSFTAFFGYNNSNSEALFIAIGSDNFFNPVQHFPDRGQPNVFLPGSHSNVFSVDFNGDNLPWNLNGTSVTANKKSTACP